MDATDLLPLTIDLLPDGGRWLTDDPRVGQAMSTMDPTAVVGPEDVIGPDPADGVLLLSDEVARAGQRGAAIIDAAVRRTRPGGMIVVAVTSAVRVRLDGRDNGSGLTADAVAHMLTERGLTMRRLAAPGAAAHLAGRDWAGRADLEIDSTPGLLDAGTVILAVARTARSTDERSRVFFSSITRKVVAASTLCTRSDGRILLVFDTFKNGWTLPGGLVDAGESPIDAAVREAHEEGGVQVEPGALLGVFTHDMPDRVHLVYAAAPIDPPDHPQAIHDHEVSEVRWVTLDGAMALLDGDMPRKLRACLTQPGSTWRW